MDDEDDSWEFESVCRAVWRVVKQLAYWLITAIGFGADDKKWTVRMCPINPTAEICSFFSRFCN
jgi:hypothetical protein